MKLGTYFLLSISPQTQPVRKLRRTASLALRQRHLYGKPRRNNTGKELDSETGLYYYGARYLDPRVSRWLSGDPAMGEYVPSAPANEEARRRNGNLPGMGGVFNCVNLHVYHYAGNSPVRLVDPDGREVRAVFQITSYERTAEGITARGRLTVTDLDTGQTITTDAFSGGIGYDAVDGVSLPLPLGKYSILEQARRPDTYRLEPEDYNFGNDIADGLSPSQGLIRLHASGSGQTYGCLSVVSDSDYNIINTMLKGTKTSTVETVNLSRRTREQNPTETVIKYGTLTVFNNVPYPGIMEYRHPSIIE